MTRKRAMSWLVGAALLLPAVAFAQTAYTNRGTNLRAGPNQEFPLVKYLGVGVPVYVNGCVEGYTWCDVTAGRDRGWVYADYLSYPYNNQPVTVISGGPLIGFPIISFSIGPYWDNYYRARPWYGNRGYWYNRPANWWYRPAPQQYHQPVVRAYPNWQRGDGHHDAGRNYNPPRADRSPQHTNPPQHAQSRPNNVAPRAERPITGEMDSTSKSQRTYTQQ
jgi:uncharacterized protein YraI